MLTEVDYCLLTGDTPGEKPVTGEPVVPLCRCCGGTATCYGSYEGLPARHACDKCCWHGNEDGFCYPIGPR